MKFASLPPLKFSRPRVFTIFILALMMFSLTALQETSHARQARLSLADILIGLRSKKVTLFERNKLLTDAVNTRGITFALTPEIEKELVETGAGVELIAAIRQKSIKTTPSQTPSPAIVPTPVSMAATPAAPVPTPAPDFAFFRRRADESVARGEIDRALEDYSQTLKLNPKDQLAYLNRGRALHNKKSYDLAIADFAKAIELSPKEPDAYSGRANAYEKMGDVSNALVDWRRALELKPDSEEAKTNLQRLQAEQTKAEQAKAEKLKAEQAKTQTPVKQEPAPITQTPTPIPESVELGQLNGLALDLVKPVYPEIARKSNVQGTVTVQIKLDEKGKVISAKAVNGHQFLRQSAETAADRTKFAPTLVRGTPVKATGFITYNFVNKP